LAQIKPYEFEGHLIIALDSKWLELLDDEGKFLVSIKNNQLILSAKLNFHKMQSYKKI
jgi:hypothetical protein